MKCSQRGIVTYEAILIQLNEAPKLTEATTVNNVCIIYS